MDGNAEVLFFRCSFHENLLRHLRKCVLTSHKMPCAAPVTVYRLGLWHYYLGHSGFVTVAPPPCGAENLPTSNIQTSRIWYEHRL